MEGLLDDVFRVASLVRRVATHTEQQDYLAQVEEIVELSDARDEILNRVSNVITQVGSRCRMVITLFSSIQIFFPLFSSPGSTVRQLSGAVCLPVGGRQTRVPATVLAIRSHAHSGRD